MEDNKEYDFDEVIDRRDTDSAKWGFLGQRYGDVDIIPLPVADMDFRTAQPIIDAIINRAEQGIYGYTGLHPAYIESVVGWFQRRHNWSIEPEWITTSPGVVPAIFAAEKVFSNPGDTVIVQTPAYYPFLMSNIFGREVVINPLIYSDGHYEMDFEDLEKKARDPRAKIMILCSPHNPVGRVWTKEELMRLGNICLKNNLLVISDEIHCDLLFPGNRHTPFISISEKFAQHSMTCTAASKTFNLAGLHTSNIIIPNPGIRMDFVLELGRTAFTYPNVFGIAATQAAYNHGDAWLDALMLYIEKNFGFLKDFIKENLPGVRVIDPEGTYLIWVDFRQLGLDPKEMGRIMLREAKVALSQGYRFGDDGAGFERINIACPRSILKEALERIAKVFKPYLKR